MDIRTFPEGHDFPEIADKLALNDLRVFTDAASARRAHKYRCGIRAAMRGPVLISVRLSAITLAFSLAAAPCAAAMPANPLTFFEGRTESVSIVRIAMKKPFRSRAIGKGQIKPDGSLELIQRVEDEGQQPRERRWRMRQVSQGHYTGTMSEANGPVTVEEIGGRYRFRFRMQGSVAIEQWLTPMPDGRSARSVITIRKYGIHVGNSDGYIHKLD
jgi:hypothetical protein